MICVANVCGLPPVVGDCDAAFPRYFYNRTSQRCERFIWGGCGGNSNRFETVEECRAVCQPGKLLVANYDLSIHAVAVVTVFLMQRSNNSDMWSVKPSLGIHSLDAMDY